MDRPVATAAAPPARVTLRPDRLVRVFFVACLGFALWLAVPPAQDFIDARERAAQTHQKLDALSQQQRLLERQSTEFSRGSGLEEQARRQGLIDPGERSCKPAEAGSWWPVA